MVRYLAYYSIGGYKDILVGSTSQSGDEDGLLYYSAFLQPWLEGKMEFDDEHSLRQLNALKDKPQMEVLTPQSSYKMKSMSKTLVAHAGYQLVCCSLGRGEYSVALRDLQGSAKDEFGRPIPFMLQLICENPADADGIANYIRSDIWEVRKLFGGLFSYNPHLNCICFDLLTINSFVQKMLSDKSNSADANCASGKTLHQIMLSEGITLAYALAELGLTESDLDYAYDFNGREIKILDIDDNYAKRKTSVNEGKDNIQNPLPNKQGCIQIIMEFVAWLKSRATFTAEDRSDIANIMKHIKNILTRRR